MVGLIHTFYQLIFRRKGMMAFLFALICLSFTTIAQTDIPRIRELNNLSDSLVRMDALTAKLYAEEALSLSLKIKNDSLEYTSRFRKAIANYFIGNLNVALEDFIKNKKTAEKLKNPIKIIESLNAIGNVYKDIERNDMALKTYQEALDISYSIKNGAKVCLIESNVAIVLNQLKQYDSSLTHCYRILNLLGKRKTESIFFLSM